MGPFLVKPNRRKSVTEKKKRLSPAAVGVAREREREREHLFKRETEHLCLRQLMRERERESFYSRGKPSTCG